MSLTPSFSLPLVHLLICIVHCLPCPLCYSAALTHVGGSALPSPPVPAAGSRISHHSVSPFPFPMFEQLLRGAIVRLVPMLPTLQVEPSPCHSKQVCRNGVLDSDQAPQQDTHWATPYCCQGHVHGTGFEQNICSVLPTYKRPPLTPLLRSVSYITQILYFYLPF